jgi:hypothetical protein
MKLAVLALLIRLLLLCLILYLLFRPPRRRLLRDPENLNLLLSRLTSRMHGRPVRRMTSLSCRAGASLNGRQRLLLASRT